MSVCLAFAVVFASLVFRIFNFSPRNFAETIFTTHSIYLENSLEDSTGPLGDWAQVGLLNQRMLCRSSGSVFGASLMPCVRCSLCFCSSCTSLLPSACSPISLSVTTSQLLFTNAFSFSIALVFSWFLLCFKAFLCTSFQLQSPWVQFP